VPIRPDRFGVIDAAPVLMTWSERVVLYSAVFGLRPRRSLEIGTHRGGSAMIIVAALDDVGAGTLACVDPSPAATPEDWAKVAHRATMFAGGSPEVLPEAREAAGGPFDFALIDGDHLSDGVTRDIEGVLPLLAPHAVMLFHDAHNAGVRDGIDRALRKHSRTLTDCGMTSVEETRDPQPGVSWGGLRMVKSSAQRRRGPHFTRLFDRVRSLA